MYDWACLYAPKNGTKRENTDRKIHIRESFDGSLDYDEDTVDKLIKIISEKTTV